MRFLAFLLSIFIGISSTSAATAQKVPTILFIDLNKASNERKAAQEAAARLGENIIFLPDPNDPNANYEMDISDVNGLLDKLSKPPKTTDIVSVIVSGHDGDEEFWGAPGGSFDHNELVDALAKHYEITKHLRSLYLWGCYTASAGSIKAILLPEYLGGRSGSKVKFPLEVIGGMPDQGPADYRPYDGECLKEALLLENQVTTERDTKVISDLLYGMSMNTFHDYAELVGCNYYHEGKVEDIYKEPTQEDCDYLMRDFSMRNFTQFLMAKKNGVDDGTDVPDDTQNGTLRTVYNYILDNAKCKKYEPSYPDLTQPRLLLFYNTIRAALAKANLPQLNQLNADLTKLGISAQLQAKELADHHVLNHHDLLERLRDMRRALDYARGSATDKATWQEASFLYNGFYELLTIESPRVLHDNRILPRSWIESDKPQPSHIFDQVKSN